MGNQRGSAGCTHIHIYMALFSLSLWCPAHFNDEIKAIFKLHLQSRNGWTQSAALRPNWTTGEFLWSKQLNASQRLVFRYINQAFSCGHWLLPCRYMWMKNWAMQLCSRKSVFRRKITCGTHSSAPKWLICFCARNSAWHPLCSPVVMQMLGHIFLHSCFFPCPQVFVVFWGFIDAWRDM